MCWHVQGMVSGNRKKVLALMSGRYVLTLGAHSMLALGVGNRLEMECWHMVLEQCVGVVSETKKSCVGYSVALGMH